jgi:hypothetical protein
MRPRRALILLHRWLGITLSLFFLMWFVSGIVMAFTGGMPEMTPSERLAHLPPLDLARVRLRPIDAVLQSGRRTGGRLLLLTVMGRPAYRIEGGGRVTIFADTGERLDEGLADDQAVAIAAAYLNLPAAHLRHAGVLDDAPDQWTIGLVDEMPLHKVIADDAARSEVYVSEQTDEVALVTTRRSRALAWAGAIPHWMYLRAIRVQGSWWRALVLWTSGLGIILAAFGLALAVVQARVRYAGWLRWHYVTGATVGIFALTWVFSGWMSMEPWAWASGGGVGGRIGLAISGVLNLPQYPAFDPALWTEALAGSGVGQVKEVEFRSVLDEPYYVVRGRTTAMVSVSPLRVHAERFPTAALLARVSNGARSAPIVASDLLANYDSYYYDRTRAAPLPILRVKFGDPSATWAYIDPASGQMLARLTRRARLNRWLYHGLHDLDFGFWYRNVPLWYGLIIVLCLGGSTLSVIGVVIGWRRVGRMLR